MFSYLCIVNTLILLVAALLPAVLLLWYIWLKDPKKEPFGQLARAVLYGVGICVPVVLVEELLEGVLFAGGEPTTLLGTTTLAFMVAAVTEESFKLLALWLVLRRNPYFDEHFDGIVYAVCVGLGFAAIENVGYILDNSGEWVSVAVSRALLAVPGHYAFAVLMGYYYSIYHFVDRSLRSKVSILLVPVVAHGIYDALAMSGMVSATVGGICSFLLIYFCVRMHKIAYRKLLSQIDRDSNAQYRA